MIHVITGKPGEGKTWFASSLIPKFLKEGKMVGCNFELDLEATELTEYAGQVRKISSFEDVLRMVDGVMFLDEAQSWFNSRAWDRLPMDLQTKWQQHRKDRVDMFVIAQDLSRIDIALRQLVGRYMAVKRWWRIFLIHEYEPRINAETQQIEDGEVLNWWIQVARVPLWDPKIKLGKIEMLRLGWKYPHKIYATYQKIGKPTDSKVEGGTSVADREKEKPRKEVRK